MGIPERDEPAISRRRHSSLYRRNPETVVGAGLQRGPTLFSDSAGLCIPCRQFHDGRVKKHSKKHWSAEASADSDAMTLEPGVFEKKSARGIASSVLRSACKSQRIKSTPFRSAMSMLNFYVNRMGRRLAPRRRKVLEKAKDELRDLAGKDI